MCYKLLSDSHFSPSEVDRGAAMNRPRHVAKEKQGMKRTLATLGLFGAVSLLVVSGASAQEPPKGRANSASPQFTFAPPGARSLAMGAAFIGLADDATASESNPAGLTILTKPELSGHVRFSSFNSTFPDTVDGLGFSDF